MSVRTIQARVDCDREILEHLWRTHRVFNERLPAVLSVFFKMRRGECGDTPKVRHAMQAFGCCLLRCTSQSFVDALSKASQSSTSDASARKKLLKKARNEAQAHACTAAFDMFKSGIRPLNELWEGLAAELPRHMREKIIEGAAEHVRSHEELTALWKSNHAEWLKEKAAWEENEEHLKYLGLRARFDAFEQEAGGRAGKRRGRWHLYIKWLKDNPDLAAWRGGAAEITPLDAEARKRVRRAKRTRQRSVEEKEFFKANPELAALHRLHGEYERRFVRRRKTKKNPDNFDNRPTFTLPDAVRHPRYFVFKASKGKDEGYEKLSLPASPNKMGSVDLRLLVDEKTDGKYPSRLLRIRFRGDPRLADFRPAKITTTYRQGAKKGQTKTKDAYQFFDRHLNLRREADISGIRLIFRMNRDKRTPRAAYLYFTCTVSDIDVTDAAKAVQWRDTSDVTSKGKKRGRWVPPANLVVCAVDLGLRNFGFATLTRYENGNVRVLRSRNIWMGQEETKGRHVGRWSNGPSLRHISQQKYELTCRRRKRDKPVHGEKSHVRLQSHVTHMANDRVKQGARAIVNFALNSEHGSNRQGVQYPRADVIVLEDMKRFNPDAERERGINRGLAKWNRARLIERIEDIAAADGFGRFTAGKKKGQPRHLHKVDPFGTSQVCSHCGKRVGRRYSVTRHEKTGKLTVKFDNGGKLFACPCGYAANADHNASVNLARRFLFDMSAVKPYRDLCAMSRVEKQRKLDSLERSMRTMLIEKHRLLKHPF